MSSSSKPHIAIIGTGMAGLACADALGAGFEISLFDKSRGLSGRLSTRRAKSDETDYAFDHGTQYFRAADSRFIDWLTRFEAAGHVRDWMPRHVEIDRHGQATPRDDTARKRIFAPSMNMIGKALLAGRPQWKLYLDTGITAIEGAAGAWMLVAKGQLFGPFDHIVLAIPPVQAAALLPDAAGFSDNLAAVSMQGCHTLMLGYQASEAPQVDWDCAHFDDDMLGFATFNQTKPGRPAAVALTLQTRHDWSEARIEDDVDAISAKMKTRFAALTGLPVTASGYDRIHRWRYASTRTPAGQPFLHDAAMGLAAIGDWCTGSKVEDAFLSGHQLGLRLRG